jgi:uncharacterized protein (DUF433 family)
MQITPSGLKWQLFWLKAVSDKMPRSEHGATSPKPSCRSEIVSLPIPSDPMLLRVDADGVARVRNTRVTLDTVVGAFLEGDTPETIEQNFSTLSLADVYSVLAYYLRHRSEVDAFLCQQHQEAEGVRHQNEDRFPPHGVRQRLLARRPDLTEGPADAPPPCG